MTRVEKVLKDSGCALVWISHDPEQPGRVGGKILELPGGTLSNLPELPSEEVPVPVSLPAAPTAALVVA